MIQRPPIILFYTDDRRVECVAAVLARMVYPELDPTSPDFHPRAAEVSRVILDDLAGDREHAEARQSIPLAWLVLERRRVAAARAKLKAGIPKGMLAGWMGAQILSPAAGVGSPTLVSEKARPVTPESLVRHMEEERGIDATNVKTRYWRPYRPVLHFCTVAFQLAEQGVIEGYGRGALINHLLGGEAPLGRFIQLAAALEAKIMSDPRLAPTEVGLRRVTMRYGSPGR